MFDERVLFGQLVLMLLFVVELAFVILGVSVLAAEHIVTLAREAEKAYLSLALPTEVLVYLHAQRSLFLKFLPGLASALAEFPRSSPHRLA